MDAVSAFAAGIDDRIEVLPDDDDKSNAEIRSHV